MMAAILYFLSVVVISLLQLSSAVEAFSLFAVPRTRRSCSTSTLLLAKKKKATSIAGRGFGKGKSDKLMDRMELRRLHQFIDCLRRIWAGMYF